MKIYEIGTGYTPIPAQIAAATESVVEELTKAFIGNGESVEIIDIFASNRAATDLPISEVLVPPIFTKSDISLGILHKIKRVVYSLFLAFKLKQIIAELNEKAVFHFHNQYNLYFFIKLVPAKLRSNVIVAYTNHNGLWSLPWEKTKDTLHKRYFQEIFAMKNADLIFALNENTKNSIQNNIGIDPKKIFLIQNGVNTDIYCPIEIENIKIIKQKFDLTDKIVILQVGSVCDNKGQVRSLKALEQCLKKYDDLVFAYAGEIVSEEYFETVKKVTTELGLDNKVIYLGAFTPGNEMNDIYNIARATIFSSEYEGFPLVCIESLSTATPVINCSSLHFDMGEGFVNFENDMDCIVEAIVYDKENVYTHLCEKSREYIINNNSWHTVSNNYLKRFKNEGEN